MCRHVYTRANAREILGSSHKRARSYADCSTLCNSILLVQCSSNSLGILQKLLLQCNVLLHAILRTWARMLHGVEEEGGMGSTVYYKIYAHGSSNWRLALGVYRQYGSSCSYSTLFTRIKSCTTVEWSLKWTLKGSVEPVVIMFRNALIVHSEQHFYSITV